MTRLPERVDEPGPGPGTGPGPDLTGGSGGSGPTRTVDRALDLLAHVCDEESITLSECARRADLPASTALRLLRTLEAHAFVARNAAGAFEAGARLVQLGAQATGRNVLVRLAEPALQRLVAATGESAYLSIAGPRSTAIYIAVLEGTHAIRHTSWVGRAVAMDGLAVGSALRDDLGLGGYVAHRDAAEPDVTAIAAPVRRPGGVAGALSLLGPTYRIDETRMQRYGALVAEEAGALSEQLGVAAAARGPTASPSAPHPATRPAPPRPDPVRSVRSRPVKETP